MKEAELQQLVEQVSAKYFRKPFRHKAVFNKRLRTTGGRYLLQSHNIELNYDYYQTFGTDDLIGVIKHELCHYHLHIEGKGYKHRDTDFRNLLKEVNAPRFCHVIPRARKQRISASRVYQCLQCSQRYVRKRKVDIERYVCGRCKGKLTEIVEIS